MAMLQHPFGMRRLWFSTTPYFRHGCLLSSYFSTNGFDKDSTLGCGCRYRNHATALKQNGGKITESNTFGALSSRVKPDWLIEKRLNVVHRHRCQSSSALKPPWDLNACANSSTFCGSAAIFPTQTYTSTETKKRFSNNFVTTCIHVVPSRSHLRPQIRTFFTGGISFDPLPKAAKSTTKLWQEEEEKSKVEEAVEAMKEKKVKIRDKAFELNVTPEEAEPLVVAAPPAKKTIWQRVKHEAVHYYNGFKLLFLEIRIAGRLLWRVMNGKWLTRRERRQFLRTAADIFRLVPFLVFLLIPFMEFMLPIVVKLFPNMLPSTFEDKSKKEEDKKKQLKVKIQMAKFLQDTVEEMAVTAQQKKSQEVVVEFANFFEKIRRKGEQPSNEDIVRFSKLFEDQITLDNMSRAQLKAINRLLMLPTIGTNNYLRFQLRMKLRQLRADDLLIQKEGVNSLTVQELQSACQARGMRAIGVPEARMRSQLTQWLELHLDEQIPASLLLMSRALYLPENISKVEQLKETLSQLPETLVEEAEIKICEVSGEQVDNKVRLDVLKKEEKMIAEEKEELQQEEEEKRKKIESIAAEILEDKAPVIKPTAEEDISQEDWLSIKESLALASERDELEKIKEDREEYQEELRELATEDDKQILKESLGSSRLGKKVDVMISRIEQRLKQVDDDIGDKPGEQHIDADGDGKISLQEMISAVSRLQNAPSEAKCQKIAEMLDQDQDGALDLVDVSTVAELLCMEDVDLTPEQIKDIVHLLEKESKVRKAAEESNAEKDASSSDETQVKQ